MPTDGPLTKAMNDDGDDDDDVDWRGKDSVRWKHKTRGYSLLMLEKNIPSG